MDQGGILEPEANSNSSTASPACRTPCGIRERDARAPSDRPCQHRTHCACTQHIMATAVLGTTLGVIKHTAEASMRT